LEVQFKSTVVQSGLLPNVEWFTWKKEFALFALSQRPVHRLSKDYSLRGLKTSRQDHQNPPLSSQMKNPLRCYAIIATILFLAACLPTGLPVRTKMWLALTVGCLGASGLGFTRAKMLYAVPLAAGYFFLATITPQYTAGILPGKQDPYSTFFTGIPMSLIVCFIFFRLGRLLYMLLIRRKKES
jgi:hypothetical protein